MGVLKEALRRRIVPSVLLTLDLADDDGSNSQVNLRLSLDFNAFALIQDRVGLDMTDDRVWLSLNPANLSVILWAAVLACHPEYASEEGLGVIRSYIDLANCDMISWKLFDARAAVLPEDRRKKIMEAKEVALRGEDPIQAQAGVPVPPSL